MEHSTPVNSKGLNGTNEIENSVEKGEKEERERDTGKHSDEGKDQKIGYTANKEDSADSIEVEYTEDLEKELERDGERGAEKKEEEAHHHHHHHGMPKGWTAMKDLRGKQKQKPKHKDGERANGTHTHMQTDMRKSQEDDNDGRVMETEVEDVDDLDLTELNSGDDLLPDEEEGGVRRGGTSAHGTDGAADRRLRGESLEHGATGSNGRNFKVYKRRWFGLVQLVLLNIIVSWDVSIARKFHLFLQVLSGFWTKSIYGMVVDNVLICFYLVVNLFCKFDYRLPILRCIRISNKLA